jgi:siroheme synthase
MPVQIRRIGLVKVPGRLQVVATPIGNLSDLSARAHQALAEADLIAAEDTRHTLGMLQTMGISKPMVSLHAYNEGQRVPDLLARLGAGEVIALVSDAGTPLLSDPGFELVSAAASAGFEVRVIPGCQRAASVSKDFYPAVRASDAPSWHDSPVKRGRWSSSKRRIGLRRRSRTWSVSLVPSGAQWLLGS